MAHQSSTVFFCFGEHHSTWLFQVVKQLIIFTFFKARLEYRRILQIEFSWNFMVALKSPMNFRSHSLVELVSEGDCPTRVNFRKIHRGMLQVVGIFQHEKLTWCENESRKFRHLDVSLSTDSRARPSTSSDDFVIYVKTNIHSKAEKRRTDIALQRPIQIAWCMKKCLGTRRLCSETIWCAFE